MDLDRTAWQRLLRGQQGVVSRRQALDAGWSRRAVEHRLGTGAWQPLVRGVLLTTSGVPTAGQWLRAGLLHGGAGSVLTAVTACRLLGLRALEDDGRVHVTVDHRVHRADVGPVVLHRSVRPMRPVLVDGLPVAPAARAVVDAAIGSADVTSVRALVAEAVQRGRCTPERLTAELEAAQQHGSAVLRRVLEEVAGGARSAPEASLLRALRRLRLPPFELNADVHSPGGTWLARPDVVFRALRLVVEVDGQRWHLSPERWVADVERHTRLEAAGWTVLRYPAARVLADADGVAAEVADVVRRLAAA